MPWVLFRTLKVPASSIWRGTARLGRVRCDSGLACSEDDCFSIFISCSFQVAFWPTPPWPIYTGFHLSFCPTASVSLSPCYLFFQIHKLCGSHFGSIVRPFLLALMPQVFYFCVLSFETVLNALFCQEPPPFLRHVVAFFSCYIICCQLRSLADKGLSEDLLWW